VWTVLHEDLRPVDSTILPARTRISRPDGRREERVTITYSTQLPNPDLGDAAAPESDDEGWEDEDSTDAAPGAEAPTEPADAAPAPTPAPPRTIPPQFILDSAGLPSRGDLCRR
jgi:hypothetical protein